jgi:hypothetical protein
MASRIGSAITSKVIAKMTAAQGVGAELAALEPPDQTAAGLWQASQVRAQNVAADLVERSSGTEYPAANVYCEKLVNKLTEKFRTFSGTAQMAIEIRYSHDRLEGLQDRLELYTDAVAQTLDGWRGDWGDGMFFAGAYEASFGAVKHGGKNFVQQAKITFDIEVSVN